MVLLVATIAVHIGVFTSVCNEAARNDAYHKGALQTTTKVHCKKCIPERMK